MRSTAPGDTDEKTIRIARKRFARRQWARRWRVWRVLVGSTMLLAVIAGGVWLVFFSSALAVADVRVEGAEVLEVREVRTAAAVPTGEPLATVDLNAVAARVEALAAVKGVDVSRSWPDKVRIQVLEREAVAVVKRDGVARGLDEDGVLFRTFEKVPRDLPVVRSRAGTRAEALAEAAEVVGSLPARLARRVDYVEVETIDTITLRLRNGKTIFWGSADASPDKAAVIEVLLQQKASVYDVSVPGRPTTRQ